MAMFMANTIDALGSGAVQNRYGDFGGQAERSSEEKKLPDYEREALDRRHSGVGLNLERGDD